MALKIQETTPHTPFLSPHALVLVQLLSRVAQHITFMWIEAHTIYVIPKKENSSFLSQELYFCFSQKWESCKRKKETFSINILSANKVVALYKGSSNTNKSIKSDDYKLGGREKKEQEAKLKATYDIVFYTMSSYIVR